MPRQVSQRRILSRLPWSCRRPTPGEQRSGSETVVSAIDEAASELGLNLDGDVRERLDAYVTLLLEANRQFNLTAIKDLEGVESRLVASSLEVVNPMRQAASVLDVGSGGGIPGMILAIARPTTQVTLLDATAKKVAFLNETAGVLGLTNLTAIHGRAEDLAHDPVYREKFSLVTARAVARLATLVELVLPFAAVGGMAILPKGPEASDEIDEARQATGFVGGTNLRSQPSQLDDSVYVLIDKARPTPERFPRRAGIPGKRPIGVPAGS